MNAETPLLTEIDGEKVDFVETTIVKDGVTCDIYSFIGNTTKDLGVVKVTKGSKTPLQKVLLGDKTLEIFKDGSGTLTVTSAEGAECVYHFPTEITEVQVNLGETMQWHAIGDLTIYEICYPPYQDGRFANIKE